MFILPCPVCEKLPRYTNTESPEHDEEAAMVCRCGFSGLSAPRSSPQGDHLAYAVRRWHEAVAEGNRVRRSIWCKSDKEKRR